MDPENSLYFRDWIAYGEEDLERAQILLNAEDLRGAAFHIQQAVEKYLKGFLLSKGWPLEPTPALDRLLNEALRYEPALERFRAACQRIAGYGRIRYPPSVPFQLARDEIMGALDHARQLAATINDALA